MRILFSFVLAVFFSTTSYSSAIIQCSDVNYAGRKLEFYSYSDPISLATKSVFTLEFDSSGLCTKTIETKTTDFVLCDFGIYRGMLFLEPNQTVKLQLPPVREKSFAEQKNPYFEPVSFWFATKDNKQLNNQIARFTADLNQLSDKYFDELYFRQLKSYYDTVQLYIEEDFGGIKSEAFIFHKEFSLKLIETDAFRLKPEDYSSIFSSVKQQFWLHPAFTNLFDKTFTGLLSFEAKSVKGDDIRSAVNQGNINFLINYINTRYKIHGDIADLALLKMLHDAFYSGDFSKASIQQMIKSGRFANHKNKFISQAAQNISEKITHLLTGTEAPNICLKNLEGQTICTNQNKDKFKYIIFADSEMAVCREHLKYLPTIQQKFEKNLDIYIVLRKTDITEMKNFLSENKVPGIKLIDEKNEFISLYKIKSFPQCYLLDENHKVKLSATKAPLDGFEQQFGTFLRQELFERQRNQGK